MATGAPTTRYARSGEYSIAYQVVGEGEIDLIYVPGLASHLELFWEEPAYSRFLHRLASFSRLILMDRLGTGLSDRLPNQVSTPEQRMDDIRAVKAARHDRAHLEALVLSRRGPSEAPGCGSSQEYRFGRKAVLSLGTAAGTEW